MTCSRWIACLLTLCCAQALSGQSVTLNHDFWHTNGTVKAIVEDTAHGRVIIGGDFDKVIPNIPFGSLVDPHTGAVYSHLPFANAAVDVAVQDEQGGWYLSGNFTKVGGLPRNKLAYLTPGGQVGAWTPHTNGSVRSIATRGDTVYIAGDFTEVNGENCGQLAALDAGTGALLAYRGSFARTVGVTRIDHIDIHGDKLYAGGYFDRVHSAGKLGVRLSPLDPTLVLPTKLPNHNVQQVLPDGQGGWIIRGTFTAVGDSLRDKFAHIDAQGNVSAWTITPDWPITSMYTDQQTLYLGGNFAMVNGERRERLAAFDIASQSLLPWNPRASTMVNLNESAADEGILYTKGFPGLTGNFGPKGNIFNVLDPEGVIADCFPNSTVTHTLSDGNGGWIVIGSFSYYCDQERRRVAHIDADGSLLGLSLHTYGSITSAALLGDTLLVGGNFEEINFTPRKHLAMVDLHTGELLPWTANCDAEVTAMERKNNLVYFTGKFRTVGGTVRRGAAAIDRSTAQLSPWDPGVGGNPHTLKIIDNDAFIAGLYLDYAGDFSDNGSAVHAQSADVLHTAARPNGPIRAAASDGNGGWYIGGFFTKVGSTSRHHLAHIDSNGQLSDFDLGFSNTFSAPFSMAYEEGILYVYGGGPVDGMLTALYAVDVASTELLWATAVNGAVYDMAIVDDKLYIAGGFIGVGQGNSRMGLAAVNKLSGAVLPWNPGANNGSHAIHALGDKLYVAGSFTQMGGEPRSKCAAVDLLSGTVSSWNPAVDEDVLDFESKGDTLFMAGNFNAVAGAAKRRLAAFRHSTGALIPSWGPFMEQFGGDVTRLAIIGDELYMGGSFSKVDAIPRQGLAKLHTSSADLLPWSPAMQGEIHVLAAAAQQVYIGGELGRIGGVDRKSIVQIDLASGAIGSFNPVLDINNNENVGLVWAIHKYGPRIILGGNFTAANGISVQNLVAFNKYTLEVIPAAYGPVNGTVRALGNIGSALFAGGEFTTVAGQPRSKIAAMHALTGMLNPYTIPCNGTVHSIGSNGSHLYIGGEFSNIGGKPYTNALALNTTTAYRHHWEPNITGDLYNITITDDAMFLGGNFSAVGGQPRAGIAAISKETGALLPFNPVLGGSSITVAEMELINEDVLVFRGNFTTVDGEPRAGIASVKPGTGAVYDLNVAVNAPIQSMTHHNGQLAIGGNFTEVNGTARDKIAMLHPITGALLDWQVEVPGGGSLSSLSANDSVIYAGGGFSNMGGTSRVGLAALDLDDLGVSSWNPMTVNCAVQDFSFDQDIMYLGFKTQSSGVPASVGGATRTSLAAVHTSTAAVLPWGPDLPTGVSFEHIEAGNDTVYVSGFSAGGTFIPSYSYLGSWLSDGTARDWNPTTTGRIHDIALRNDGLHLGGTFTSIAGTEAKYLSKLSTLTALPMPEWNPEPNAAVNCIGKGLDDFYIGGQYGGFGSEPRDNVAAFDIATGQLLDFAPSVAGYINDMLIHDNKLYMAGSIAQLNGESRGNVAAVSLPEGTNEAIDIYGTLPVLKMAVHGDDLYLAGYFVSLNNTPASRLGKVNTNTGAVQAWNFNVNDIVWDLTVHNDMLYFCGFFTAVGGEPRQRLAAIDLSTDQLSPWNPGCDGYPTSIAARGDVLYTGGGFSNVAGQERNGLAAFHLPSGGLSSWNPAEVGSSNYSFAFMNNLVFAGGEFGPSEGVFAIDQASAEPLDWVPAFDDVVWKVLAGENRLYVGGEFNIVEGPKIGGFAVFEFGDCSAQATCSDVAIQLDASGSYTLQLTDLLLEGATEACLPVSASFSQGAFTCADAGVLSLSANLTYANGTTGTCDFALSVLTLDDGDDDGDGIVNFCDFCYGDNSTGDSNGNGICDGSEVVGCMNSLATNYNPLATTPGLCLFDSQPPPLQPTDELGFDMGGRPAGDGSGPDSGGTTQPGTKAMARLYPNPLAPQEAPSIALYNPGSLDLVQVRVYDTLGRLIHAGAHSIGTGHNTLRPLPHGLHSEGVYYCTLALGEVLQSMRFVVSR